MKVDAGVSLCMSSLVRHLRGLFISCSHLSIGQHKEWQYLSICRRNCFANSRPCANSPLSRIATALWARLHAVTAFQGRLMVGLTKQVL